VDEKEARMTEFIQIILAGISTLAIYSFLYRENVFYRTFEHVFIGVATAWGLVKVCEDFLWPRIYKSMFGYDVLYLPDGTRLGEYQSWYLWYLIPAAFSLLYYTMYSVKYRHLAQLVISFQLGCAGGFAFKGTFVELMPQIYDSFRPVYFSGNMSGDALLQSLSNAFFLLTLFSAFMYFFFTFRSSESKMVQKISTAGRLLMMACFGATFGSTMMARMALLVERLDFLSNTWFATLMEAGEKFL
jgi:hypothetical protein